MYSSLKIYLKEALGGKLPGADAHRKMLPEGRVLRTPDLSTVKPSSVLLLIFPENDQLFVCLTKRPASMRHHPGQISFPGGKAEKEDLSAEMTALREAREEIGIDISSIEILGKLSDFYVYVSEFSIQPFLAWVDQKPDFKVNTEEVEALILLPLTDFLSEETISETDIGTITGPLRIKYYPYNGEFIWGATAMILSELIEILKRY